MGRFCSYFGAAAAVALLAGTTHYCYKHVGLPDWYWRAKLPDHVTEIDVSNTEMLKRVLFSGEPWLLQCYSGLPFEGQHLPRRYRMHPAFAESISSLRGLVQHGILDCEQPLPSNKTLVTKYGLVRRTQPLLILAGGGHNPKQVPSGSATSAYGITAFVKPKAEPRIIRATSQQQLRASCGARRPCLLTRIEPDSLVLQKIAAQFRTIEVVSVPESAGAISWGRGDEIGETLEEEEAVHFGKRISLLRMDPESPPTKKQQTPARLLRGFGGEEDLPSLSRFVSSSLILPADDDGWMRTALPTLNATTNKKPKKTVQNDNAEVQARRARKRAQARAKEEAEAAELAAQQQQSQLSEEEQQREREMRARARMAAEEEQAGNIVEEVDEEGDLVEEEEATVEEDEEEEEAVDLDL